MIGKTSWDSVASLLKAEACVLDPRSDPGPLVDIATAPPAILRIAIQRGAAVNPRFRKALPLVRAVEANLPVNVRLLLASGARPNDRDDPRVGNSAVDAWANWGQTRWTRQDRSSKLSILKALVAAHAKLDVPGGMENATPLWRLLLWHCISNDPVDAESPPTKPEEFTRHEADLAVMLLKCGVDANARCPFKPVQSGDRLPKGATPLFIRPIGDGKLHRALLAAGANPLLKAADGRNAIEFLEDYREELLVHRVKKREEPLFADSPAIVKGVTVACRRLTQSEGQ
ncbi:MAG: hypothetical protein H7210_10170 [Pyrinomonadaceae bacterium]|nr:hypothetical protein [Phycisphaerales bacterium]